jgi:hypothetical protein
MYLIRRLQHHDDLAVYMLWHFEQVLPTDTRCLSSAAQAGSAATLSAPRWLD